MPPIPPPALPKPPMPPAAPALVPPALATLKPQPSPFTASPNRGLINQLKPVADAVSRPATEAAPGPIPGQTAQQFRQQQTEGMVRAFRQPQGRPLMQGANGQSLPAYRGHLGEGGTPSPTISGAVTSGLNDSLPAQGISKLMDLTRTGLQSEPARAGVTHLMNFGPNVARAGVGGVTAMAAPVMSAAGALPAWLSGGREGLNGWTQSLEDMRQAGATDFARGASGMFGLGDPMNGAPSAFGTQVARNASRMRGELPDSWLPAATQLAGDTAELTGGLAADVANAGIPGGAPLAEARLGQIPRAFADSFRGGAGKKLLSGADAALTQVPDSFIGGGAAVDPQAPGAFQPASMTQSGPPKIKQPVQVIQAAAQNGSLEKTLADVQTNKPTPSSAVAVKTLQTETGSTPEQAKTWYDSMSTGEKVLLGLGLGLSTISLLGGSEGIKKWLPAILGLVVGGGALAHAGVLGEDAQGMAKDVVGGATRLGAQGLAKAAPYAPSWLQDAGFGMLPQGAQDQLSLGADVTGDGLPGLVPDGIAYKRLADQGIGQDDAKQLFEVVRQIKSRQQPVTAGP